MVCAHQILTASEWLHAPCCNPFGSSRHPMYPTYAYSGGVGCGQYEVRPSTTLPRGNGNRTRGVSRLSSKLVEYLNWSSRLRTGPGHSFVLGMRHAFALTWYLTFTLTWALFTLNNSLSKQRHWKNWRKNKESHKYGINLNKTKAKEFTWKNSYAEYLKKKCAHYLSKRKFIDLFFYFYFLLEISHFCILSEEENVEGRKTERNSFSNSILLLIFFQKPKTVSRMHSKVLRHKEWFVRSDWAVH